MAQMPPLPVQPNFEQANKFLPSQAAVKAATTGSMPVTNGSLPPGMPTMPMMPPMDPSMFGAMPGKSLEQPRT